MLKLLLFTFNLLTHLNHGVPVHHDTTTNSHSKEFITKKRRLSTTGLVWQSNNHYLYGTQDIIINQKIEGDQDSPNVGVLSNGDFVFTWRGPCFDKNGTGNSSYGVYAQVYSNRRSTLRNDILVSNCVSSANIASDVTTLSNDEFVIVWHTFFNNQYHILGSRYNIGGQVQGNPTIFEVSNSTTVSQKFPSIDTFADDSYVVVWQIDQLNGAASYGVLAQRFYPNNTKLGSQIEVNNYPGLFAPQTNPKVATFGNGGFWYNNGFIVAFEGYDNPDGPDPDQGVYTKPVNSHGVPQFLYQVNGFTFDYQEEPSIATFPNNDMVIVWQDRLDGSGGIIAQKLPEDQVIVTPMLTANTYVGNQKKPAVAGFKNGQYVVGWMSEKQNSMTDSVYGQLVFPNSTKLGFEFLIPNNATGNQRNLKLATIDNNQFVAVWEDDGGVDGNGKSIVARVFFLVTLPTPSPEPTLHPTAWQVADQVLYRLGDPFIINSYTPGNQYYPSVDSNNDNYYVFWHGNSKTGIGSDVYGQYFDLYNNRIGVEINATSKSILIDSVTSTALFSDGYIVAFSNTSHTFIQSNRVNTTLDPVIVSTTSGINTRPHIVSRSDGSAVITWVSGDHFPNLDIKARLIAPNLTLLGTEIVVTNYTNRQDQPQIGLFPNDSFLIVWESFSQDIPSSMGVFGKQFDASGSPLGPTFQINNHTTGDQSKPTVSTFPDYGFVVAWYSTGQNNGNTGIYGQLFDANSNREGSEFQLHTYTGELQTDPYIISLPNNQFLAAWQSYDPIFLSSKILAQLFSRNAEKVGTIFPITAMTSSSQTDVHITSFPSQAILFVYTDNDGDGSSGAVLGQFWQLNTLAPTIAPLPTFHPTAWEVENQTLYRPRAPFVINSYNIGNQYGPSIDSRNNNYYVFWVGESKTGFGSDIYGQQFSLYNTSIAEEINVTSQSLSTDESTTSTASFDDGGYIVVFSNATHIFAQGVRNHITFTPLIINTETGINTRPHIARRNDGTALITWAGGNTSSSLAIKGRLITANFTLTGEVLVLSNYTTQQNIPQAALFSNDSFVTVWVSFNQDNSNSTGIFGQRFDASGIPISPIFQVNTYTQNDQNHPRVITFDDDGFVVIWDSQGQNSGLTGIYGQFFDANTKKKGAEFQVHSSTKDSASVPYIVNLPNNQFLVAWQSSSSRFFTNTILAQVFSRNGVTIGNTFEVTEATVAPQSHIGIAVFPSDEILFVYTNSGGAGSNGRILGQFWELNTPGPTISPTHTPTLLQDDGEQIARIGKQLLINTDVDGIQQKPDLATLPDGSHIVVWEESNHESNNHFGIYAQFLCPDGSWEDIQIHINKNLNQGDHLSPKVAISNKGTFMTVWRTINGNHKAQSIYQRTFTTNKEEILGDLVSQTVTPLQSAPQVASYSNGHYIITWHTTCTSLLDYFGNPIPECPFLFKYRVVAKLFLESGQATTSEIVLKESNDSSIHAESAITTITPNTAVVVWRTRDAILGRRISNNGTLLGHEFEVANTTGLAYQLPDITAASDGGFIVTFLETVNSQVLGQRFYANTTKKGTLFTIDSSQVTLDLLSVKPTISSFADKKFFITFHASASNHTNIYGQFFETLDDESLVTIGNLTLINSYTNGTQQNPVSTTFGNTTLLTVWDGQGPYDSQGIFGQVINIFTGSPTTTPTQFPSLFPTHNSSNSPSKEPSISPSKSKSYSPSKNPSLNPTQLPSLNPTNDPTRNPSRSPSHSPTINPTLKPSVTPTNYPTNTLSQAPTQHPTLHPSSTPTYHPTLYPTYNPSLAPTLLPSKMPTNQSTPSRSFTSSPSPSTKMSAKQWLNRNIYSPIWVPIVGLAGLLGLYLSCLKKRAENNYKSRLTIRSELAPINHS